MKSSSELQPILRILSSASSSFSTVTYPCIDNMNRILIFFHTNNRPSHGLTLCLPSNILSPRLIPLVHGDRSGLSNIPSPRRGLIPLIHGNTLSDGLCLPSNILSPRLIPLVHGDSHGLTSFLPSNIPSPRRGLIPLIHGNSLSDGFNLVLHQNMLHSNTLSHRLTPRFLHRNISDAGLTLCIAHPVCGCQSLKKLNL
ncbi:unnamed protein product, partial [Vitis vinifera]